MDCPHCNENIPDKTLAKHLAAKGGRAKKVYSPEEKKARAERMAAAREKRWPGKLEEWFRDVN